MLEVATESLRPTLQATPLRPLLAVVSGLILIGVVASWRSDAFPDVVGIVGAGALAAGVALGLDDEADTMLRSSPSCARVRLGHPLTILLPPLLAGQAHPLDDLFAAVIANHYRRNRRSPRWQLIDHRAVQIGIGTHRQGARNRCGGHDQLVWAEASVDALLP